MFHLFQTYVASVLSEYCKSRYRCGIYMEVFQMFSYVCCKWFHPNVCNSYTRGFQVFQLFSQVFQAYVASVFKVFRKCFMHMLQVFRMYSPRPQKNAILEQCHIVVYQV
jgi:hypothetical protein